MNRTTSRRLALYAFLTLVYLVSTVPVGLFLYSIKTEIGLDAFAARSGAAVAAEIGSMVVTEQVDALRSMAIAPSAIWWFRQVRRHHYASAAHRDRGRCGAVRQLRIFGCKGVPGQNSKDVRTYTVTGAAERPYEIAGLRIPGRDCRLSAGLPDKGRRDRRRKRATSSVVLCVVLIFIADFFMAQILTGRDTAAGLGRALR